MKNPTVTVQTNQNNLNKKQVNKANDIDQLLADLWLSEAYFSIFFWYFITINKSYYNFHKSRTLYSCYTDRISQRFLLWYTVSKVNFSLWCKYRSFIIVLSLILHLLTGFSLMSCYKLWIHSYIAVTGDSKIDFILNDWSTWANSRLNRSCCW